MDELVQKALPFMVPALLPALFLVLAPLQGRRMRTVFALILLVVGFGLTVDVLVIDHTEVERMEVPNFFPRGPEGEPHRWVTATVEAPPWHWHICLSVILIVPGLLLLLRRNRPPRVPQPVLLGTGVFLYYLCARLALETAGVPDELGWAFGATPSLLVILPFFAWYCGRRGMSFGRFTGTLVLLAFLQRLPLIAFGYFATTQQLGTHLDTHVVTDVSLRPFGEVRLDGSVTSWIYPTLIPHLTVWIAVTLVAGLVLGALPFLIARRRVLPGQPAQVVPRPRTR